MSPICLYPLTFHRLIFFIKFTAALYDSVCNLSRIFCFEIFHSEVFTSVMLKLKQNLLPNSWNLLPKPQFYQVRKKFQTESDELWDCDTPRATGSWGILCRDNNRKVNFGAKQCAHPFCELTSCHKTFSGRRRSCICIVYVWRQAVNVSISYFHRWWCLWRLCNHLMDNSLLSHSSLCR